MKKRCALLLGLIFVAGLCFAVDPVEGYWISYDEKTGKPTAGWRIYAEQGVLFGRILSIYEKSQDEIASKCKETYKDYPVPGKVNQFKVTGSIWIFGLRMDSPGVWSNGSVIDPQDGKMYKCKITFRRAGEKGLAQDSLEMRGEIGLGIGRSQYWKKATQAQAEGLR